MALSTPIGLEKQIGPQVGWKGCEPVGWGDGCAEAQSPAPGAPPGSRLSLTGPWGLTASLETPHTPHSSAELLGLRCWRLCESSWGQKNMQGGGHYGRQEGVLT